LITITEKLKILAGIRYSYLETYSAAYTNTKGELVLNQDQPVRRYDQAFSPRVGVVYQPLKTTSLFASYANSFNPNTGATAKDINFQPLSPSIVDQYEIGVKNDLFDGLLSANVTLYQIINSDFPQAVFPAPDANLGLNPTAQEMAGEVTSKGLEVDIMTKSFQGFSFIGGYSYNQTKYTKSNIYQVGSRLRYNPAHTANASVYYTFSQAHLLKGFNAGLSAFYVGDMVAGRSTRLTVPDDVFQLISLPNFFQFDVSAGYTVNNLSLRVRATNLFNKLSYYAHDDNSINPIAPRMLATTVSYRF
jgi:iron complex outermembrane receptor protein